MPREMHQLTLTSGSGGCRIWLRRAWPIAPAVIATGVLAGCGGATPVSHVASLPSARPSSSSSVPGVPARARALAYSQCMRAQGIGDFPDPNAAGELAVNARSGSDIDPNNPKFTAAQNACASLLPASTGKKPARADTLKYSHCMRAHKISDFPDPQADGTLQVQAGPGSDLDPNNALFVAANKACEHILPGVMGGGGSTNTSNGS
jgi:hypothetical protein